MNGSTENSKTFVLAIETSGMTGGVALGKGTDILGSGSFSDTQRRVADLLPTIDGLCRSHGVRPSQIGGVYVSAGPGSFTGLRIGLTVARIIALGVGAKIVTVPTLEVIAQNALCVDPPPDQVAVILDAKRARVYAAAFVRRADRYEPVTDAAEVDPASFLAEQPGTCAVLGSGVIQHRAVVDASGLSVPAESLNIPRADTVFRLGARLAASGVFTEPGRAIPIYVRRPEAEEKWEARKQAGNGQ